MLANEFGPILKEYVTTRLAPLLMEISALTSLNALARSEIAELSMRVTDKEERIKQLESRPHGAIFVGPYEPGRQYALGDGVQYQGGYWVCQTSTRTSPGDGGNHWKLAVRRGKSGRDADMRVAS
jgi:hypothetical protein